MGGRTARLGDRADPETASVTVDGVPLPVRPGLVTYLVNKPAGVVSTSFDPEGRPTVVDLVPPEPKVFPVGRLDADSEGLLLLTNDGELANLVTHPRYGITKTYNLMVDGRPDASTLRPAGRGRRARRWLSGGGLGPSPGFERAPVASRVEMGEGRNARSAACSMRSGIGCSPCSVPP